MPMITVKDDKQFEVEAGKRLVLALEDNGVDILHRCGGNARCTTCCVVFHTGEPTVMTEAEHARLQAKNLEGVRLSCQILTDQDMTVEPVYRLSESEHDNPGGHPADAVTPDPVWLNK